MVCEICVTYLGKSCHMVCEICVTYLGKSCHMVCEICVTYLVKSCHMVCEICVTYLGKSCHMVCEICVTYLGKSCHMVCEICVTYLGKSWGGGGGGLVKFKIADYFRKKSVFCLFGMIYLTVIESKLSSMVYNEEAHSVLVTKQQINTFQVIRLEGKSKNTFVLGKVSSFL